MALTPTTTLLPFLAVLAGAVSAQAAPDVVQTPNRYDFPVWRPDWPVALDLPTPAKAALYERSRRQALDRVIENLKGDSRREVWLMAIDFFGHAPKDAVEPMVEALDRHLSERDMLVNIIEAMGRMGDPGFEDGLRRMLEHGDETVRQSALSSLSVVASPAVLESLYPLFLSTMNGRARAAWLRSARLRMGAKAVPYFRQMCVTSTPPPILEPILKEVVAMPADLAAECVANLWEDAHGPLKATVAGILHAAGRTEGSLWLHDALRDANDQFVLQAMPQLRGRPLALLQDDALLCSTHPRPEVRLELAKVLVGVPGEQIDKVYEVLAGGEELIDTKAIAIAELVRRGHPEAVTPLIEDLRTATGTRVDLLLRLLSASGDDRAVEVLRDRFLGAPANEGRGYLQGIANCRSKGAGPALLELFAGPERAVNKGEQDQPLTTLNYIPLLLANIRVNEAAMFDFWPSIARDDYQRRSRMLQTLNGIGIEREDPVLKQRAAALLREVLFDAEELPQLRIQALNHIARRSLTIDDVVQLRKHQEPDATAETPQMRALIKDFLFEYF